MCDVWVRAYNLAGLHVAIITAPFQRRIAGEVVIEAVPAVAEALEHGRVAHLGGARNDEILGDGRTKARRRNLQISFQERLDTVDMTLDHGELEPRPGSPLRAKTRHMSLTSPWQRETDTAEGQNITQQG